MSEEKETHFMKRAQRKACWEAKELNQIKKNISKRKIYIMGSCSQSFHENQFQFS